MTSNLRTSNDDTESLEEKHRKLTEENKALKALLASIICSDVDNFRPEELTVTVDGNGVVVRGEKVGGGSNKEGFNCLQFKWIFPRDRMVNFEIRNNNGRPMHHNGFNNVPVVNNVPATWFSNVPAQGFNNAPAQCFKNAPVQGYNNAPANGFSNVPAQGFNNAPVQGFNNVPVFNNVPAQGFNNAPVQGFNNAPATGLNYEPDIVINQEPCTARHLSKQYKIFIKSNVGEKRNLDVESTDTIKRVKTRIQEMFGFDTDKQVLRCSSSGVLEDGKTVTDYFITNGSEIFLTMMTQTNIQICIKMVIGLSLELEIDSTKSLGELKSMIEKSKGIPVDRQRLVFAGKQLDNNSSTLAYSNIENGATIHLL